MTDELPPGGVPVDEAGLVAHWANCWHPREVAARLDSVTAPWYVAAGWALDLFRGSQSRPHSDLEIAVPAGRFDEFRTAFAGYEFDVPGKGRVWPSTPPELLPFSHQTWLWEPATGTFLVDVFREPHDGDTWICRQDETLRLPYTEIIERTEDGIPYLIPELVLLLRQGQELRRPGEALDWRAHLELAQSGAASVQGLRAQGGVLRSLHPFGHDPPHAPPPRLIAPVQHPPTLLEQAGPTRLRRPALLAEARPAGGAARADPPRAHV